MFSQLETEPVRLFAQKLSQAISAIFGVKVQVVSPAGKVIAEGGDDKNGIALAAEYNDLTQDVITPEGKSLGTIEVAYSGAGKTTAQELKECLLFASGLLSEKVFALQAEETRSDLAAILDITEEGIFVIDEAGYINYGNLSARTLLGFKQLEDLVGCPIRDIWPELAFSVSKETSAQEIVCGKKDCPFSFVVKVHRMAEEQGKSEVVFFREVPKACCSNDWAQATEKGIRRYFTFADIIGRSEVIEQVKEKAVRVAAGNSTVLITGESGTGKEVFAQSIHCASPRAGGPFVSINCGAIPENLLESELFGYEEGAFTGALKSGKVGKFELADRGTIFLDEIGEMSLHLQVKLLHVLQNREVERVGGIKKVPVDVRIIAASNRDLDEMMEEKKFRKDLYFRLGVIPLHIPPLRERKEDIPLFVERILKKYAQILNSQSFTVLPAVMEKFIKYRWPGNVRELENAIEYAINMSSGKAITVADLPPRFYKEKDDVQIDTSSTLKLIIQDYERHVFEHYLQRFGSSSKAKNEIAQMLGISRATLYRKLAELGLS